MGKNNVSSLLTSLDDLFTTQEERDSAKRETVLDIPLSEISDFPNHPFKVRMDEAMMERTSLMNSSMPYARTSSTEVC